jgi:hypothetical protein
MLPLGHDGNDLSALGLNFALGLGQRLGIDTAIRTPVATVKYDRSRSLSQGFFEADQPANVVWEQKGWHRISGLGCRGP